jgi:hypothetical protein
MSTTESLMKRIGLNGLKFIGAFNQRDAESLLALVVPKPAVRG